MIKLLVMTAVFFLADPAFALEPIPGSITYGGGPRTRLMKSPISSSLTHVFRVDGAEYEERYVLTQDRTLNCLAGS